MASFCFTDSLLGQRLTDQEEGTNQAEAEDLIKVQVVEVKDQMVEVKDQMVEVKDQMVEVKDQQDEGTGDRQDVQMARLYLLIYLKE